MDIEREAVEALCAYQWPGNVRELQNILERAVALSPGDTILADDLPQNIKNFVSTPTSSLTELPPGGVELEPLIEQIEVNLIRQALQNVKHSQKKAAELLGLTPRSLRYRMQKYGLDAD